MKRFFTFFFMLWYFLGLTQNEWLNFTQNYSVTDVVETEEGYWISSTGGLCYYDLNSGEKTYFNRGNSAIPSNNIQDIILDSDGSIWMSTTLGLCKFSNGNFEAGPTKLKGFLRLSPENKIIIANYDSLYIQIQDMNFKSIAYPNYVAEIGGIEVNPENGIIYFNAINFFAETYIAALENEEWTILFSDNIYGSSIALDKLNRLWLLTDSDLSYYDSDTWIQATEVAYESAFFQRNLFVNQNNDLLFQTTNECPELISWNGVELSKIDFINGDCSDCQFIKASEKSADLYFATNLKNGLYTIQADKINPYANISQSPLFYNNLIATLHPSDQSHILVFYDKIQNIKNGEWTEIEVPDDLTGYIKEGILNANDILWIHDDYFLWQYKDGSWTKHSPPSEITDKIQLMAAGPNGEIWIQSNLIIARFKNDTWQTFGASQHGISTSIIKDLSVDSVNGDLWVSSFQGVRKYDGELWTTYTLEPNNQCFKLAIANGGIFVRSSAGLNYIENDIINEIPMPENAYYGTYDSDMEYDGIEEKLYFAGTNSLAVYQNELWTEYSTLDAGMYNGNTNDIHIDQKGNLWLSGTEGGLCIFNEDGVNITSVQEASQENVLLMNVFPTLVNRDQFFIESEISGNYSIVISDISGRILIKKILSLVPNQASAIFIPDLPAGVLIVNIRKDNRLYTKRIIKVH